MADRDRSVLATLRRVRRGIAGAMAPALLSSVLAGAACPVMGAAGPHAAHSAGGMPAAQHHEHATHEHHAHDRAPVSPAQPERDCPHCLGGHAAANAGVVDCEVVAAAPPAPKQVLPSDTLAIVTYVSPAASPIPPLIRSNVRANTASISSVPLHIRHCVLLI